MFNEVAQRHLILFYSFKNIHACIGDDLSIETEIPFMTSIFGGQEKVRVRRMAACEPCSGR